MEKVKNAAVSAAAEEVWDWKPRDDEEEVGGDLNIWNPAVNGKEGDELVGEVLSLEEGVYGIQAQIETGEIDVDTGKHIVVTTPAHKVLQSALVKLSVADTVRITYTGAYKAKNGLWAKTYKVARKK